MDAGAAPRGLHDELSHGLADLVEQCVETGKKGTLVLKITCAPQKDELTMLVTDDVKVAAPRPAAKPTLFFPSKDGQLLRQDPNQMDISALKKIDGGKAEVAELRKAGEGS